MEHVGLREFRRYCDLEVAIHQQNQAPVHGFPKNIQGETEWSMDILMLKTGILLQQLTST